MDFQLVLKSVTLNDLEQPYSPHFALFHRIWLSRRPITSHFTVVEDSYILAKTNPRSSRTVFATAELLVILRW